MKAIILLLSALTASMAFAHEGHDKTPGKAAPHGGIIKGANQIDIELVSKSDGVSLYAYGKEMKPISSADIKIEGKATFPKKGKPVDVAFKPAGEALAASIDAKGSYRYTLDLVVNYGGKKSKIKFNVEPQ